MPGEETTTPRPFTETAGPVRHAPGLNRAGLSVAEGYVVPYGAVSSSTFPGRIPRYLGQYEILHELGRGGMGIVFLAKQPSLNRNIALKVLNTSLHTSEDELRRFRAEAQMAAQLHHPNIVQVFEVGEQDGLAFLAMEHVEGGSLHQHLAKNRLTPHDSVELLEPLARAMHYAHLKGIVHRDLKPANILLSLVNESDALDAQGRSHLVSSDSAGPPSSKRVPGSHGPDNGPIPKITDFGLAKRYNQTSHVTATGIALGTPSYMAPEQARDDRTLVGPASDVYSLGAILYEMLTGRPPFFASSPLATLEKVVRDRPIPPSRLAPEVSPELERIVLKCLEKKPQNRYPSAEALADDLRHFLVASDVLSAVQARWNLWNWIKRHPTGAIALLGILVFLIAVTFYKLREEAADADKFARDVQNNARKDHDEAILQRLVLLQRELPLTLQRGLALCEQGDIDQGLQWLQRAQAGWEEAQLPVFDRAIRANLASWERQLSPVLSTIQVPDGVLSLASSPRSSLIASGGKNGTIRFWDPATAEQVGESLQHPMNEQGRAGISGLAWSSDGKFLASASRSQICIWSVAERRQVGSTWDVGENVEALHFSTPCDYLLFTIRNAGVRFRKIDDPGNQSGSIIKAPDISVVWACSHDGKRMATSEQAGQLRIWTGPIKNWVSSDPVSIGSTIEALAWSADDREIIISCHDGKLFVWDIEANRLFPLRPQGNPVHFVVPTLDGRRFITGTQDGVVRLFDTLSRASVGQTLALEAPVTALICPGDGKSFAVGHENGSVRIYRLPVNREIGRLIRNPDSKVETPVHTVQFSGDGSRLLVATSFQGLIQPITAGAGLSPAALKVFPSTTAALSPNGKWVAFGGPTGTELIEVQSGKPIPLPDTIARFQNPAQILFSPNSARLIYLSSSQPRLDRTSALSWLWNLDYLNVQADELRTRPTRILTKPPASVNQAAFHPNGRWLVLACADRLVRIWDIDADALLGWEFQHPAPVLSVALNKDGTRIFAGCLDGSVHLWNAVTGEELWSARQGGQILSVAVSADDAMLLSGSSEGTARFWDPATGIPIGPALYHADAVLSVGFRIEGKLAVTGSKNGVAQIWKVPE